MSYGESCACSGIDEIINDLRNDDLLELGPGERLWKLYCFRAPGHATELRHRIYTKRKPDGRLAMVTFAAHNPAEAGGPAVRSALARVPDLAPADLDRLIDAMQTQSGSAACEAIDLSRVDSLEGQWTSLIAQPPAPREDE